MIISDNVVGMTVETSNCVSRERKHTLTNNYSTGVKQKDIVEYYGIPQLTVSDIIMRGMHKNEKD